MKLGKTPRSMIAFGTSCVIVRSRGNGVFEENQIPSTLQRFEIAAGLGNPATSSLPNAL
jgi:hypothetical protein